MSITIVDVETPDGWRRYTDTAGVVVDGQPYQPRLEGTGGYARHLFEPGATLGAGSAEAKPIPLTNADRVLDALHRQVDGRRIVVRQGEPDAEGRPPKDGGSYTIVFQGRMEPVELDGDVAELRILSRGQAIAEAPVTTVRFDGTATSGGAGLGGGAEMAGKPRPILVGYAYNFEPPWANAFDLVCQVSQGGPGHSAAFGFVKDRGAAITAGTQHATLAALRAAAEAATVTPSTYDWYSGDDGTWLALGSTPAGVVTVEATEGGGRTVAEVAAWLLEQADDVASGNVLGVAAMNGHVPGESGIWIRPEDRTLGSALEEVLAGVGSWYDSLDDLTVTVAAWRAPEASDQAIAEWELLGDPDLLSSGDVGGGAPVREVLAGYRRNYTPLNKSELEETMAAPDAAALSQEWLLTAPATVPDATTRNPLAQAMRIDTSFRRLADAERIRDRHRDLRTNGIDLFRLPLPTARVRVDIGQGVTVTTARFGLAAGALCGVIGRDTTGRTVDDISVTDLIAWRPSP